MENSDLFFSTAHYILSSCLPKSPPVKMDRQAIAKSAYLTFKTFNQFFLHDKVPYNFKVPLKHVKFRKLVSQLLLRLKATDMTEWS